jgi:hypothetical protein
VIDGTGMANGITVKKIGNNPHRRMVRWGPLSAETSAHIERAVREGMVDKKQEHRRLTNLGRPNGHGDLIFIGPRF